LDIAALRRLRLQAGYSTRRLARALGTSATTVRGLEADTNHEQMPLGLIVRLADLLHVAPAELFARCADEPSAPCDDDRAVEAALASLEGLVSISDLARALDWTLDRACEALDVLEARLLHTGCRLHRNAWQQCSIRPATQHLARQQQQAIQRIGPRQRGLTHTTARVLMASSRGEIDDRWFKTAGNADRVALQSLLKQGALVARPGETRIVPVSEVAYGLDPYLSRPPAP
jgi:transcriptional regulator with XRE-family HTH domain